MNDKTGGSHKRNVDLVEGLAKSLSEQIKLPVFYVGNDVPEKIAKIVEETHPELLQNITKEDLHSELQHAYVSTLISNRNKPKEELIEIFAEKFDELLRIIGKGQKCTAYVFISDVRGIPIGTKLGNAEVVSKESIKFSDDHVFWEHIKHHEEYYRNLDFLNGGTWLKCVFTSHLDENPRQDLYAFLEQITGLISALLYGFPIIEESIIGVIIHGKDKRQSYVGPNTMGAKYLNMGWARYDKHLDEDLKNVSSLLSKTKKSYLEEKIILSSKLFSFALQSKINEIRLVTLVSALESLLLTKNDRDYLGTKLAEKSSFLLRDDLSGRLNVHTHVKQLYSLRSKIVHGSSAKAVPNDVSLAQSMYIALLRKLLSLSKTIKSIDDFDNYINDKKFS